jgi:hypothetical protein
MSKLILTALGAIGALGLTACGEKAQDNNLAVENVEDLNTTEDLNMDMNATDMNSTDMNSMDMNATTGNEATGNSTGY